MKPRRVSVVLPVYGARLMTMACLQSVLESLPAWARIVVIDDASPDPELKSYLNELAGGHVIDLLTHPRNRGFTEAANTGMRYDNSRDIVLLNSDTLVPTSWLERLRRVAYSASDIGTVTPISNEATILSYPRQSGGNEISGRSEVASLDRMAQRANEDAAVDLPTGVGFCMYIKRDCLADVGLLRTDFFAQGYGEENDFCMRARQLGWRHVAAPGVFVGHVGGQSFGMARRHLIDRNQKTLNLLYPGYDRMIASFVDADPLAEFRRRIDREIWISRRANRQSVLLVTHSRSGGVKYNVEERSRSLRAEGLRPIVISPATDGKRGGECVLSDGADGETPNLRFGVPTELDALSALLIGDRPLFLEIHSLIGHDHAILGLSSRLEIPYEIVVHDYSSFCPRITLIDSSRSYCGEPPVGRCDICVANNGSNIEEAISASDLVIRSTRELHHARRVLAPSADVANRLQRHFPNVRCEIRPWEDDSLLASTARPPAPALTFVRVAVIGAISVEKGYDVLFEMARDAAIRTLPLEFILVGYSQDDGRLLSTGRIQITGPYSDKEAVSLIRTQKAHFALQPAVWPETWSYTVSRAWEAGLDVVAFDIGTPAERIRRTGRGWLIPLTISASDINDKLLSFWSAYGRESSIIQASSKKT